MIVQIYKLSPTESKTKARVVKVNQNLLHIILQVNQSKISHWNPSEILAFVAQMNSGKKSRSALWSNAMHCGKKWWIRHFYVFFLNPDHVAAERAETGHFILVPSVTRFKLSFQAADPLTKGRATFPRTILWCLKGPCWYQSSAKTAQYSV